MGFRSIVFICPKCRTVDKWGTSQIADRGHCRGELDGARCDFEWRRCHDWAVFRRAGIRQRFRTREEYEAVLRAPGRRAMVLN
jgi:hypothetical protein